MFENEIIDCENMEFEFNNEKFEMNLHFYPMMDSKLIDLLTGLGGAYCTMCTCSEEEAVSVPNIVKGETNSTLKNNFSSFVT